MNNEVEQEIVVDIRDLLYRVLKQWRGIVIGAIVIALLAGAYKAVSGIIVMLDPEKYEEAVDKYSIVLGDFEATGERLKTNIQNLRDDTANQQEYNEKSVLMRIDPMNKWVGSFVVYIDSGYKIDPTLTVQDTDPTYRLIMAYAGYLSSGELYNVILANTDIVDEIRFLTEIYWINVDSGSSSITVNCVGQSEADVREILDLVKENLDAKSATIAATIADHTYEVLMESIYSTIDLNLDATQKNNLLAITNYANAIGETNEALTEWEEEPEPRAEYGVAYTIKQTIKFIIIGGVAGCFVMVVALAIIYVLGAKMRTDVDWAMLGILVLGHLIRVPDKKAFWQIDRWVERHIGGKKREVDPDTRYSIAANNVRGLLHEKGLDTVMFVSDLDAKTAVDITKKLDSSGTDVHFSYAGNLITDAETVTKLKEVDAVILLGEDSKSIRREIQEEVTILKAWGKTILGAVVIE